MARTKLRESLDRLHRDVVQIGRLALEMAEQVAGLGIEARTDLASAIEADARSLRALRADVERRSIALLATQAPVASDLRRLSGIMKVAADFEAIGDSLLQVARVTAARATRPQTAPAPRTFATRLLEALSHTVQFCDTGDPQDASRARSLAPDQDAIESLESALVASIKSADDATDRMPLLRLIPEVERVSDLCRKVVARVEYALSGQETAA
jgi:phosphate transport system protein